MGESYENCFFVFDTSLSHQQSDKNLENKNTKLFLASNPKFNSVPVLGQDVESGVLRFLKSDKIVIQISMEVNLQLRAQPYP